MCINMCHVAFAFLKKVRPEISLASPMEYQMDNKLLTPKTHDEALIFSILQKIGATTSIKLTSYHSLHNIHGIL